MKAEGTKAVSILLVAVLVLSCQRAQRAPTEDYSDKAELAETEHIARDLLSLKLDRIERQGADANVAGLKTDSLLFSRRLDSRTYFVQDVRYGVSRKLGIFQGSNDELSRSGRELLRKLGIPSEEIGKVRFLSERTMEASVDPGSGRITTGKEGRGKRFVSISRLIEGIPVFNSRGLIGLTQDGQIGFLEVHWPEIAKPVVREAHRLQYRLAHGWRAPEWKGATVETAEVCVIHSPAVGFLMDIYPAIRVTYAPSDSMIRKKPVLYFDRSGLRIPSPRQFANLPEQRPEGERRRGKR